ncbi:MAG: hypothetical protein ACLP6E_08355 [Acidimicrobiales bacterium]
MQPTVASEPEAGPSQRLMIARIREDEVNDLASADPPPEASCGERLPPA